MTFRSAGRPSVVDAQFLLFESFCWAPAYGRRYLCAHGILPRRYSFYRLPWPLEAGPETCTLFFAWKAPRSEAFPTTGCSARRGHQTGRSEWCVSNLGTLRIACSLGFFIHWRSRCVKLFPCKHHSALGSLATFQSSAGRYFSENGFRYVQVTHLPRDRIIRTCAGER